MNSSNEANQMPASCCGKTSESFDCAAMMEMFKNCCDSTDKEGFPDCCSTMLAGCCDKSDTAEK